MKGKLKYLMVITALIVSMTIMFIPPVETFNALSSSKSSKEIESQTQIQGIHNVDVFNLSPGKGEIAGENSGSGENDLGSVYTDLSGAIGKDNLPGVTDPTGSGYAGLGGTLTGETVLAAEIPSHTHPGSTWIALPADGTTVAAGKSYYLNGDVTLTKNIIIPTGQAVTLCLNGNKLIAKAGGSVIMVSAGATLNLCDCQGITATNTTAKTHSYTKNTDGLFVFDASNDTNKETKITGGVITGASYENGGGIFNIGTLNMSGGTIAGNKTTIGSGGGIYNNGKITMNGGAISGNTAVVGGGGVYNNEGKTLTMSGGTISENMATNDGGGVFNKGTFTMSETAAISGNTATTCGGGVFNNSNGTFTMTGGTISGNETEEGGGVRNNGTFTLTSGTISNNAATKHGGGVFNISSGAGGATSPGFTMSGGVISNNTATNDGGGVVTSSTGVFLMSGGVISGNNADNGGGVRISSNLTNPSNPAYGTFKLTGGTISGNNATIGGGVANYGNSTMTGGTISGNTVTANGGGVSSSGTFNMSNGTISGNTAKEGGGVQNNNAFTMTGGTITQNTTTEKGAGVSNNGNFELKGGTISGNNAGSNGGGVFNNASKTLIMTGGEISGNTATSGGGIFNSSPGAITMSAGAISGNTTKTSGGGVHNNGIFNASGSVHIWENYKTTVTEGVTTKVNDNLFLLKDAKITVVGKLSNAKIGVNLPSDFGTDGVFTTGYSTAGFGNGEPYNHFISDVKTSAGEFQYAKLNGTEVAFSAGHAHDGAMFAQSTLPFETDGITYLGGELAAGNYYLSKSGKLSQNITIKSGTVNLCLNGFVLSGNGSGSVITVEKGATLNLCDCNASQGMNDYFVNADELFVFDNGTEAWDTSFAAAAADKKGTILGGVITGGTGTKDTTAAAGEIKTDGGGIFNVGTLNMTDGTIAGNTATTNGGGVYNGGGTFVMSKDAVISGNVATKNGGGGVYNASNSTFTMNGGVVSDNVSNIGGGVYSNASFNMSGTALISGNKSTGHGGGVFVSLNGTLTMTNGTISNNTTTTGNGGGIKNDGTFTMSGASVISGNTATAGNGGGIYTLGKFTMSGTAEISGNTAKGDGGGGVYNGGTFEMTNGNISNNKAEKTTGVAGGVFNNTGGAFTMSGGTISGNSATADGGGVYNNTNSTFTMSGKASISNNNAARGGGVFNNGTFTMSAGTISDNLASERGGGVWNNEKGTFDMTGGVISNNEALINGGGVYNNSTAIVTDNAKSAPFTMSGGEISGNTATQDGGGVYNNAAITGTDTSKSAAFIMSGTAVISGNTANQGGGGVLVSTNGVTTITGGTISGNTATTNGGGVQNNGIITMTGGTISGNNAEQDGGGVYSMGINSKFTFTNSTISGNTAKASGGGVIIFSGTATMTDSTISGNTAGGSGGGIFNNGNATFTMERGTISKNTATATGGGLFNNTNGEFIMKSGTISENTAKESAGGVANGGTFTMTGGVVSDNTAAKDGGGIHSNGTIEISGTAKISGNTSAAGVAGGVLNAGTFTMTGEAEITGNTASTHGGGVYIADNSTFNMGGTSKISGNKLTATTASWGGGVHNNGGSFTMSGGTISENKAIDGGGVFNFGNSTTGTFTMTGGTITKNTATKDGGGVHNAVESKSFTMSGTSEITGNTAGQNGGGVFSGGTFNVSGPVRIWENYRTTTANNVTTTVNSNVYLVSGKTITVGGVLSGQVDGKATNAKIGVTLGTGYVATAPFTTGYGTTNGTTTPYNFFQPDAIAGKYAVVSVTEVAFTGTGHAHEGILFDKVLDWSYLQNSFGNRVSGNAYLTGNLTLDGTLTIAETETAVNLCLNGYKLIGSGSGPVIEILAGATLNLCDCNSTSGNHKYNLSTDAATKDMFVFTDAGTAGTITGGVITGGSTTHGGGIHNSGILNMSGGIIAGNNGTTQGGGVHNVANATFTMTSGAVVGNVSTYGGGVYNANKSKFTMSGGKINNNNAKHGGGSYGSIAMSGGIISGNTATGEFGGGGIYATGGISAMSGTAEISGNTAARGGGVFAGSDANSQFNMSGGKISGNTATGNGGGVYVNINGAFNMTGGTISGNKSPAGGGIQNGGTFTMSGGEISGNTATTTGGGVSNASTFTLKSGIITGNKSVNGGGVFINSSGILTFSETAIISGNTATENGGGVYVNSSSTFNMTGGEISGNISKIDGAGVGGGGVFNAASAVFNMSAGTIGGDTADKANNAVNGGGVMNNGTFTLSGTAEISSNTATTSGGGVINNNSFEMSGTAEISGNTATAANGGGVFNNVNATFTLKSGKIFNNEAKEYGGGVYNKGTLTMDSGEISNNTAIISGGGVFINYTSVGGVVKPGTFNMNGGTISGNTATTTGGGVFNAASAVFNMNGGTIGGDTAEKANSAPRGGGVYNNGTFTMNGAGALITGNTTTLHGAGVYNNSTITASDGVAKSAGFTLTLGTISKNVAIGYGGGVFNNVNSYFTMTGGVVGGDSEREGNSAQNGGGVYNTSNASDPNADIKFGTIEMTGGTISSNTATDKGGGVFNSNNTTFNMNGGEISGNTATTTGGGVYNATGATFTMTKGTIGGDTAEKANSAPRGGGVYSAGNFTMSGTAAISGNEATLHAGGVYIYGTTAQFEMSDTAAISNNTAALSGGGISNNGIIIMNGGEISGNTATTTGGGGVVNNNSFEMSGAAEISGNTATGNGGGIYNNGTFNLISGTISGNTATEGNGGGVYNSTGATFAMTGGTIGGTAEGEGNTAATYGGGVYSNGTFEMNGTATISNNTAESGGGVSNGKSFTMSGGTISGNEAKADNAGNGGGGVYNSGTFNMTKGTIGGTLEGTCNSAVRGGGVFNNGTFTMSGTAEISGNNASKYGGGVNINTGSTFDMASGTILNNKATANGGGVYCGGEFTLSGTAEISGNSAPNGAGVYNNSTITSAEGNTKSAGFTMNGGVVKGNTAENGGGVYNTKDATFDMASGTISGNTATTGNGGGVYNNVNATFTLSGGEISGNLAKTAGGGIYNNGTFNLSGAPKISGNKLGTSFEDPKATNDNIHLPSGKVITITGALSNLEKIGVNLATDAGVFTSGYGNFNKTGDAITAPDTFFSVDKTDGGARQIGLNADTGEAEIVTDYTITFDAKDGSPVAANVTVKFGEAMPTITDVPTKTGSVFMGYFDSATGGTKYYNADGTSAKNFDKKINTTLYAQWKIDIATVSDFDVKFKNGETLSEIIYNGSPFTASNLSVTSTTAGANFTFEMTTDAAGLTDKTVDNTGASSAEKTGRIKVTGTGTYAGTKYVEFEIKKKDITAKVTTENKVYDGTNSATFSNPVITGLVNSDDVTLAGGTVTFTSINAANGITAETNGFSLSGAKAGNYNLTAVTATAADITEKELIVTWTGNSSSAGAFSWVYSGNEVAPTAKVETGVGSETVGLTVTGGQTDAGVDYTATAAMTTPNTNYTLTNTEQNFTITRLGIALPTAKTLTYNGTEQTGVVAGTGYSISGNTGTNARDYSATVTPDQNHMWSEDSSTAAKTITFTIEKAKYNMSGVSFGNDTIEYDGAAHGLTITGALPTGADNVQVTVSYSANVRVQGEHEITATFATTSTNYEVPQPLTATLTITKRALTVDMIGGDFEQKTYTGSAQNPGAVISDGSFGIATTDYELKWEYQSFNENAAFGDVTTNPGFTNAGTYKVTVTATAAGNYSDSVSKNYVIAKADTVITVTGVTKTYTYTGKEQTVLSGATLNHSEISSLTYSNNTFTTVADGNGKVVTITAAASTNYNGASATVTLTVNKAATITDNTQTETAVYDGAEHFLTVSATGFLGTDTFENSGAKITYSTDETNWSETNIGVTNVDDSTTVYYNLTFDNYETIVGNKKITITSKDITVKPDSGLNKVYGGTDPTLSYTLTGVVTGENAVFNGTLGRAVGEGAGDYGITKGSLVLANGADTNNFKASNYNLVLSSSEVKFTITQKALAEGMIGGNFEQKTYDGTEKKVVPTISDTAAIISANDYTVTYKRDGAGTTDFTNAGTITVVVTGKGNYSGEITKNYVISKAELPHPTEKTNPTFTFDGTEKTFTTDHLTGFDIKMTLGGTLTGTSAGSYTATVSLTEDAFKNYKWEKTTEKTVNVTWHIDGSENRFTELPKIVDWTFGGNPNAPSSTAKFGTATYQWKAQSAEDSTYKAFEEGSCPTDAGTYTLKAIVAASPSGSYAEISATVDFTINKKEISVPSANTGLVYSGVKQDGVNAGDGYTISGGKETDAGEYEATVTVDTNHKWATGVDTDAVRTIKWSIAKANVVVTWPTAGETEYGKLLSEITLTGGLAKFMSGLGEIEIEGDFAWTDKTIKPTVTNSGYEMTFTPTVQTNYEIATTTVQLIITPKELAVTWTGDSDDTEFDWAYNGAKITPKATVTTGVTGETLDLVVTADRESKNASETPYTATASTANGNYTLTNTTQNFTISKATPTWTDLKAETITYGDLLSDSALTGTAKYSAAEGVSDVVAGVFAWTSPNTMPTVANSGYEMTFTPNDQDNFNTVKETVSLTVNKKAITVTIENKESMFGAELLELKAKVTSGAIVIVDKVSEVYSLETTATASSPAGKYPITGKEVRTKGVNYDITFVNGTYTITSSSITDVVIVPYGETAGATYDGAAHPAFTSYSALGVTTDAWTFSLTDVDSDYTSAMPQLKDAGTYTVHYKIEATNFEAKKGSVKVIITKAPLSDATQGIIAEYDGVAHSLELSATGFVGTEDIAAGMNLGTLTYGKAADSLSSTNIVVTNAGTTKVYYKMEFKNYQTITGNKEVKIDPKEIAVTWTGDSDEIDFDWVYNSTVIKPVATVATGIEGETLVPVVTADRESKNAGTYTATATITNDNYKLTVATTTQSFTISKAPLTVTAKDVVIKKNYDGTTDCTETFTKGTHYTITGGMGSDLVNIKINSKAFVSANVGDTTVPVTFELDAATAKNYSTTDVEMTFAGKIIAVDDVENTDYTVSGGEGVQFVEVDDVRYFTGNVTVTISLKGTKYDVIAKTEAELNGSTATSIEFTLDGKNIEFYAKNSTTGYVGHVLTNYGIDSTAPTVAESVTITDTGNSATEYPFTSDFNDDTVTLTFGSTTDAVSGIDWTTDGKITLTTERTAGEGTVETKTIAISSFDPEAGTVSFALDNAVLEINGTYKLTVTDKVGNAFEKVFTISKHDNVKPTVSASSDISETMWSGKSTITFNTSDDKSGVASVTATVNGTDATLTEGKLTLSTTGENLVRVTVTDKAGNETVLEKTYYIDTVIDSLNDLYVIFAGIAESEATFAEKDIAAAAFAAAWDNMTDSEKAHVAYVETPAEGAINGNKDAFDHNATVRDYIERRENATASGQAAEIIDALKAATTPTELQAAVKKYETANQSVKDIVNQDADAKSTLDSSDSVLAVLHILKANPDNNGQLNLWLSSWNGLITDGQKALANKIDGINTPLETRATAYTEHKTAVVDFTAAVNGFVLTAENKGAQTEEGGLVHTYESMTSEQSFLNNKISRQNLLPIGVGGRVEALKDIITKITDVETLITAIPAEVDTSAPADFEEKHLAAKEAYGALTAYEKGLVSNAANLTNAETKYAEYLSGLDEEGKKDAEDRRRAGEVIRAIGNLAYGTVNTNTGSTVYDILNVQKMFDDLSDEQETLVSDEIKAKLADFTTSRKNVFASGEETETKLINQIISANLGSAAREELQGIVTAYDTIKNTGTTVNAETEIPVIMTNEKEGQLIRNTVSEKLNQIIAILAKLDEAEDVVDQIPADPDHCQDKDNCEICNPDAEIGTDHTNDPHVLAVENAKIAYEKLTDHEKSLLGEEVRKKIEDEYAKLIAAISSKITITDKAEGLDVSVLGLVTKVNTNGVPGIDTANAIELFVEAKLSQGIISDLPSTMRKVASFDVKIMAQVNGGTAVEIQPTMGKSVLVKLPVGSGVDTATAKVYHLKDSGSRTLVENVVFVFENGQYFAIFETSSFSEFVVVDEKVEVTPPSGGGGSGGGVSKETRFWRGVDSEIKAAGTEAVVVDNSVNNYAVPQYILADHQKSGKTLTIKFAGGEIKITAEMAAKVVYDKSKYTYADLDELFETVVVVPTPTPVPTPPITPDKPEQAIDFDWVWKLLGGLLIGEILLLILLNIKKKKKK